LSLLASFIIINSCGKDKHSKIDLILLKILNS